MGKGRKRKQGARTKSGRLSRAGQPRYDKGTERAQAMQALYGADGADAIGRAYRAGLLGSGSEAKALLDTARKVSNAYWAAYEVGGAFCTLGDKNHGGTAPVPPEVVRRREEWLNGCLDTVKALGHAKRRCFEQLVVDVNPDCGPHWLDRLCYAHRSRGVMIEPADATALENALTALAELADVDVPKVVRFKRMKAA